MVLNAPLLAGLRTFEAAARAGSFTKASQSLHITTGAVSQQIRQLEEALGFILFERHSRGISLTPAGRDLFLVVQRSLQDIESAIRQLQQKSHHEGEVKLKLTPSFAYKWLVPRLQSFYKEYPDIRVLTFAEGALLDVRDNDYDLAIDYGKRPYPDSAASLLLAETLIPVMSPAYAENYDWDNPACWNNAVLLHDAMPWQSAPADYEWRYWFDKQGMKELKSNRGHFFNRTDMAMEAAAAGLGVALARGALVADDFKRGRLLSPFESIDAGAGYYLLQPERQANKPAVQCFKQWLLASLKG